MDRHRLVAVIEGIAVAARTPQQPSAVVEAPSSRGAVTAAPTARPWASATPEDKPVGTPASDDPASGLAQPRTGACTKEKVDRNAAMSQLPQDLSLRRAASTSQFLPAAATASMYGAELTQALALMPKLEARSPSTWPTAIYQDDFATTCGGRPRRASSPGAGGWWGCSVVGRTEKGYAFDLRRASDRRRPDLHVAMGRKGSSWTPMNRYRKPRRHRHRG